MKTTITDFFNNYGKYIGLSLLIALILFGVAYSFLDRDNNTNGSDATRKDQMKSKNIPVKDIPTVSEEVDIKVVDKSKVDKQVEKLLKNKGDIDTEDSIDQSGQPSEIGKSEVISMQQKHNKVPVIGAETRVILEDGKITDIQKKLVKEIKVSTKPKLTFDDALLKAYPKYKKTEFGDESKGELVLLPTQKDYKLAWKTTVDTEEGPQEVIIDANSGDILKNTPLILE